jgi:hypothetical protein
MIKDNYRRTQVTHWKNSWQVSFIQTVTQTLLCTYLIGRLLGATCKYVFQGLDPGVDCASCWFSFPKYILVYSGPCSFLLFVPTAHISHSTPSLPIGGLTLFTLVFTLFPLLLAGRLPLTIPIGHTTIFLPFLCRLFSLSYYPLAVFLFFPERPVS